jgi:hypothetical protein
MKSSEIKNVIKRAISYNDKAQAEIAAGSLFLQHILDDEETHLVFQQEGLCISIESNNREHVASNIPVRLVDFDVFSKLNPNEARAYLDECYF